MKAHIIACILAIPFLVGCSTTYYIPQISDAEEYVDAQAKLHGRPVTVTLVDGTEIRLDSTSLHSDSISGVKEDTGIRQGLPFSQVEEIRTIHLGRGAMRGGMNGFIGGGVFGLLMGATYGAGAPVTDPSVLGFAAGCAFAGALLGSIFGLASSSTEYYIFSEDAEATFRSQKTEPLDGTNPQYVLTVEKFLEETDSTVTIPWQGKTVRLPKSEINIEKHEKRYRITVPARLLQ